MSARIEAEEAQQSKGRLDHVLLAGLAQQPAVGVNPSSTCHGQLKWTVIFRVMSMDPVGGKAMVVLKFGKPEAKEQFLFLLALHGAAAVPKPGSVEYLMTIPDAIGKPLVQPAQAYAQTFDEAILAKVTKVVQEMSSDMQYELAVDGDFFVFTVIE